MPISYSSSEGLIWWYIQILSVRKRGAGLSRAFQYQYSYQYWYSARVLVGLVLAQYQMVQCATTRADQQALPSRVLQSVTSITIHLQTKWEISKEKYYKSVSPPFTRKQLTRVKSLEKSFTANRSSAKFYFNRCTFILIFVQFLLFNLYHFGVKGLILKNSLLF